MPGIAQRQRGLPEGLREGIVLLLAVTAACAAGAAALTLLAGDEYEATAVASGGPERVAQARSREVARRALDAAGASREPASALLEHSTIETRTAGGLSFTVRAEDTESARQLAGAYARAYVDALPERARARAGMAGPAERTGDLVGALLVGAGVGALAGLVLALLREALDVRRTSSRTVAARLGSTALGNVPGAPESLEHAYEVAALEEPDGPAAAAYARVAARLAEEADRASARTLLVAGTVPEDEAELVAANLAASLAAGGRRVAIAELEHGRASLRRLFALERGAGPGRVPGVDDLTVLGAGDGGEATLDALAASSDLLLVCAPPLLRRFRPPLPPADGLVLAVHLHHLRRSRRPRLERLLRRLDVPLLGFVLVGAAEGATPPQRSARPTVRAASARPARSTASSARKSGLSGDASKSPNGV